jgi:type II secretory pathway pseudopilin PulG
MINKNYTKKITGNKSSVSGQTLIETVVAIFILVMGITAAAGLAIYALNTSSNTTKQIIATGLAREGVEAVKNMRDTNWLKIDYDDDCYNYQTGASDAICYQDWLGDTGCGGTDNERGYCMDPGNSDQPYRLVFSNSATNKFWTMQTENQAEYGLNLVKNINDSAFTGYYVSANGLSNGNSDYYRKVTLTKTTSAPYHNGDNMEKIEVLSQVWWADKKCPRATNWSGTKAACRVEIRSYLTNWKDY